MSTPIEEIKERLDIVEVVQEYVSLKKAGANHKGRCPFHNEKTPSFTVSEAKQFFHCFGCSKGGDMFTFIQEVEGVEFAEALRMLAQKAGVELKATDPRENNERTRLIDCLTEAAQFFRTTLEGHPNADHARAYVKERGVTDYIGEQFMIGYASDSWDALMNHLKKKGFTEKEIEKAGLSVTSQKNGSQYDRFRDRIMFPIHNAHGNVVGFTGRTLKADEKEAKYVNTPQTAVYNKSAVLYGLSLAKQYIKNMNAAVVVEGQMDVVTAHQAKFRNVVAASGTALTTEQIALLKRYSNNIMLAFDADAAGVAAAWRGMRIAIQQGMNIKVLAMPEGEDPDDMIKKDPQKFRQLAIEARPFMEQVFHAIMDPLDLSNVLNKKKAAAEILPMIALFPDKIEQTHYVQELAVRLQVESGVLMEKVNEVLAKEKKQQDRQKKNAPAETPPPEVQGPQSRTRAEIMTERLFALASGLPEDMGIVFEKLNEEAIVGDQYLRLYKQLKTQYNAPGSLDGTQPKITDPAAQTLWSTLQIVGEELYGESSVQERQQELLTLLESVERSRINRRLKTVEHELATAERDNDATAIQRLSEEFQKVTELLRKLS